LDWLLFQKGFLLFIEEEMAYKRRLAMAKWMETRDGQADIPYEGGVDPRAYESHWLELLRVRPNSPYSPAALYYLGFSRQARGELDSALVQFAQLTERYPESPYAQQALIFIGEHHFHAGDLPAAEKAYDQVLEYPESKYFDQALYKLAWTRYRASTYKTAISSFTFLLEESLRKGSRERQGMLTQEALQYTALSLAESDTLGDGGQDRAQTFGERLGDPKIAAHLLHKMAGIYMQQGRLDRARRALGTLLEAHPDYERHPQAMLELASAYDKDKAYGKAADLRERMTTLYGPGQAWYDRLDGIQQKETDSVLYQATLDAARHYLYEAKVLADQGGDTFARNRFYEKAIYLMDDFIRAYPSHSDIARLKYDQAEAYFAMDRFDAATRKYLEVSRSGDTRFTELAAYNAIVSAQEFLQGMKDGKPVAP
jgi:outer membrane protein assembly factor BamD (BamD/ComL family)